MSDSRALSILLFAVLVLYVVSPIDCVPGPFDDLILILAVFFFND